MNHFSLRIGRVPASLFKAPLELCTTLDTSELEDEPYHSPDIQGDDARKLRVITAGIVAVGSGLGEMEREAGTRPESIEPSLSECLGVVFNGRLDRLVRSLGGMGPRYYLRLNSLAGNRSETLEDMRSHEVCAEIHETFDDAAYLRVRETSLNVRGKPVEADRFAAEAVLQGANLYAPGVRKCEGLRAGESASISDQSGTVVGSGVARQSERSVFAYRQGIAVQVHTSRYGLPSLMESSWYKAGLIHLQSLPAMVTCRVLDPRPGEVVVDLNCAPGGKMSYISQLSDNKARVIGFDRNAGKIEKTRKQLERLKCSNYRLVTHDSRYVHLDYKMNADKVLVDPPCTGLGVMPKLSIETTHEDVKNLSAYQKQFLTAASGIVKQGGTVVYSVCTVTREECEEVARFAEENLGLVLEEASPFIGQHGLDEEGLTQRFDPELDGAGYFIARFVKQ